MFSSSKSNAVQTRSNQPKPSDKPSAPSILSSDLHVIGNLNSDGEIQVDGVVDGDIFTTTLMVGESAVIKGEIHADVLIVHGTVNGQINGRSVSLMKTSHVIGDIHHEELAIEKGAFLEGRCQRIATGLDKKESGKTKINLFKDKSAGSKDTDDVSISDTPAGATRTSI